MSKGAARIPRYTFLLLGGSTGIQVTENSMDRDEDKTKGRKIRSKKKNQEGEALKSLNQRVLTNHLDLFNSHPIRSRSFSESNITCDSFVKLCHEEILTLAKFNGSATFPKPCRLRSSFSESQAPDEYDMQYDHDYRFATSGETMIEKYKHYLRSRERKIRRAMRGTKRKQGSDFTTMKDLPADCKIIIFSYLSSKDKGSAAQVCTEWHDLMKVPQVWSHVDFTEFNMCYCTKPGHQCTAICYENYMSRMKHLFQNLTGLRPTLKHLRLAYDIDERKDKWLLCIEKLLHESNCRELATVHINWKETPCRPFWLDQVNHTVSNYSDFISKYRHRQRIFVNFFDYFTTVAKNIEELILPFDWSMRSVECLGRLNRLHTLVVEKYFVFQALKQDILTEMLEGCSSLRKLVLEIWVPSGREMTTYEVSSKTLRYLDISQCRGFYVSHIDTPSLKRIKILRQQWNGPLVIRDQVELPCLYKVLASGAKNLELINDLKLSVDWFEVCDDPLDSLMKNVCSCKTHKSGWAM